MNNLDEIKRHLQNISNVTDLDIGLLGKDRTLLIGTGKYGEKVGSVRPEGCCLSKTTRTGEEFLISEPRKQSECMDCEALTKCPYAIVLSAPVFSGSCVIGTLGMLGYKPDNANKILSQAPIWKQHVSELSGWLSRYTVIPSVFQARDCSDQIIKSALNLTKEGVLITDNELNIIRIDRKACDLLGGIDAVIGRKVNEIIPREIIQQLLDQQFTYLSFKPKNSVNPLNVTLQSIDDGLGIKNGFAVILNPCLHGIAAVNREPDVLNKIIGSGTAIAEVKQLIRQVARTSLPVLIVGESGTGKELAAQAIHQLSSRQDKLLVCINCAAIPDTLAESELFGYEGGAFTGAKGIGQKGKFELANEGTLFLDEIEELSTAVQAKLLRVVEKNEICRIGGKTSLPVNVRIIAATNISLEQLVRKGRFREDLYFRLNAIPVKMPALRSHAQDIPVLARHFLFEFRKNYHTVLEDFSPEIINVFTKFQWPGNVRQLKNVVDYLCVTAKQPVATIEKLPFYFDDRSGFGESKGIKRSRNITVTDLTHSLDLFGDSTEGKKQAANHLGISLPTFYRKIKQIKKGLPD